MPITQKKPCPSAAQAFEAVDWEDLYPRLAVAADINELIPADRIGEYKTSFFKYVEGRDDKRAARLLACDNVAQTIANDPHAAKMRDFVGTEMAVLRNLHQDRRSKGAFTHIGCGGMAETLIHASQSGIFEQYRGVDNRVEAVNNANNIFARMGVADRCRVAFSDTARISERSPKTVMLAAYLHPDRQTVFDAVCDQTRAGDIVVLRNVTGALKEFSTPVSWDSKAKEVGVSLFPSLGIETRYLRRTL